MYSDDKVLYLLRLWGKRNSGSKIRWWNKNRNIEIISKSLPFNQFNPKSKRHRIDRNLGKFQILASFVLIWFGRSQLFNFESRNLFKAFYILFKWQHTNLKFNKLAEKDSDISLGSKEGRLIFCLSYFCNSFNIFDNKEQFCW